MGSVVIQEPNLGPHRGGVMGKEGTGPPLSDNTKIVPIIESFNFPKYRHSFSVYVPSSACESANDSLLL